MEFTKKDTRCLKGIAIILMLFHHCFLSSSMYDNYYIDFSPFSEGFTNNFSWFGKECVSVFVFLSGYGLAKSYKNNNKNIKEWYIKRLCSLYKVYWFIFIFAFIICNWLNKLSYTTYFQSTQLKQGLLYVLIDFMGLSNIFQTPSLNGAWWYTSVAIAIILLMPLAIYLNQKIGSFSLLVLIIVPRVLGVGFQGNNAVLTFLFVFMCGVIFEHKDWLVKINKIKIIANQKLNMLIKFLVLTPILCVLFVMFQVYPVESFYEFNYGIIAVYLVVYCYLFICNIPIIKDVLECVGKHSANIFYVHIFVRSYYAVDFIYSFERPIFTVIVLLMISLIISIIVEQVKKLFKYDDIWSKIQSKIVSRCINNNHQDQ